MNYNILVLDGNYVLKALLKVTFGVIAQLVERCDGIAEVSGSRPLNSIRVEKDFRSAIGVYDLISSKCSRNNS